MKLGRLFLVLFAIALLAGVAAILFNAMRVIVALWVELLAGSSFIFAAACLPAAVCAATLDQGRMRGLMWSGVICAVLAGVAWVAAYGYVSSTWNNVQTIANVLMLPTMWAALCAVSALMFSNRRQSVLAAGVGFVAWIASLALILLVGVIVWTEGDVLTDGFHTALLVCVVLSSFGTMLALVLQRLPQLSGAAEADQNIERLPLRIWCPRCGEQQRIQTGGAHCSRCGLSVSVKIP